MAKYLVLASYSSDGIKGVVKSGGTARSNAVKTAVESAGGTMESFYFGFGETDAYVVVDLPDNTAAAAVGLAVSSTGLADTRTVVLLTPSEIDDAATRQVGYAPPGS